ncbi:non-heme dioxygenase and 2OG-Fe(II) oxygenase superfamily protein [Metarhizium robertsii]|uniref:Oxoglutarate/iron-dependent oxygenase n=2 Tax=Metarhizium robertsii TaxID=568076 RepID=E9FBP3_METRA|nr:Oxoglutarate/iron-dependent oxygenase [Metarhizium robertsii ARSEF 23]EFY94862.1 Oxoglutarate/iron-dependent oxygenase [Metarhizium robertsii ARSEF 23]EXU96272.1 non-heme dioxygenase and 2OG-Fe(II) oxygenase superfamily protein [Metarhizium robertsii]
MDNFLPNSRQTVRILDFADFLHGDANRQSKFCRELIACLSTVGFVKLVNHGLSDEELYEVFEWNKRFFSLPLAAKTKAAHPYGPNPHRGYSYIGQEKLSKVKDYEKGTRNAVEVYDVKESFDQGPAHDELYPNRWPDEGDLPNFRVFMERLYERCHQIHQEILQALALGLGLGPGFFRDICDQNTSEVRLNHYPGCEAAVLHKGAKRISEHTDFGTVTLLFQDSVGGLEIEDQHVPGDYFPIPFESRSEMIVNIGDCLQRWSNDKFRATSHRVVLPPGSSDGWIEDRYSVAYFGKPNRSQAVGALPELLPEGLKSKYSNITAWEYNQEKLTLTY